MIRRFLFILFLYVLLVWLIAVFVYPVDSRQFLERGILWTALGVGALLVGLIVERVFAWRHQSSAATDVEPKPSLTPSKALHEDDAALMGLLKEADDRLAKAPNASTNRTKVRDLPFFLVLGPEGAGKTAVLQNSGIEPSLLAGQVSGSDAAITSTRVANIWFADSALFLEISGRVFSGEPDRLAEFISIMQPGAASRGWRSWFDLVRKPVSLRGVLLCIDSRDFVGAPEPSTLDRTAQKIRERLLAISNAFGTAFPVYVILTKLDGLPYFREYFARLSDEESGQVFGVLRSEKGSDAGENRVWAEAETKRLNKAFQSIFGRLSDRRLLALMVEPNLANKPAIYEFPREFKRIRNSLVQFFVDVFKPDPLNVSPHLRGFFFTGTKKVEREIDSAEVKSIYSSKRASSDATHFFRPGIGASSVERLTSFGKGSVSASAGQLADRWVFLMEFFNSVLFSDHPVVARVSGRVRFEPYRKHVAMGAVGLAALMTLVWTISWIGNWRLSSNVETVVSTVQRGTSTLSLLNLQALDAVREQLEQLDNNDSWSLRWGLYQGDALRDVGQRVYFARLRQLSLDAINRTLAAHLQRAASEAQPTVITYDRLKTHRTITTLGCPVDRELVSRVLKATALETHPGLAAEQMGLLQDQLDYYAKQFERKKQPPIQLTENLPAVEEARRYLSSAGGVDQQVQSILSQLNQQIKPVSMAERAEDYRSVLSGNPEIAGAFTKRGYDLFDDLAAKVGNSGGEACVVGVRNRLESAASAVDSRARDRLKSQYLRRYADAWKEFLASYSVIPYSDARDAAMKLKILSASRSPLLGLIKLIAVNTNFPPAKPGEVGFWEKGAQALGLNRTLEVRAKTEKAPTETKQLLDNDVRVMVPSDLARLFQPVLYTTPPEADVLVNDHDLPYVEGLRKLQGGLDGLVRASASEKPAAISLARAALEQARNARNALADKFNDVGNEGLSRQLADLMEQPIRLADRPSIIPPNADISLAATKNGDLTAFCRDLAPILSKYPFNPTSPIGASTTDLSTGFAPNSGKVWKYALGKGADLVVKVGAKWERNPNWQGPRATQDLVSFLSQAQLLTNALFTEAGMLQPKLKYTLRPSGTVPIRLVLDGTEIRSKQSSFQKPFYWPAQGADKQGAEGSVDVDGGAGFGRFDGLWGVFHLFQNADERGFGQTSVQWSGNRGRGGAVMQTINPPARVEFVEFPGGVDLFNPKFFETLTCPGRAVTVN